MSIELKITGETPKDFYANVLNTFALMANGVRREPFTGQPRTPEEQERFDLLKKDAEARERGENIDGSERRETVMVPEENPKASDPPPEEVKTEKKKRGRPATKTVDAEPAKPATVHDDPIPDFLVREPDNSVKKTDTPEAPAATLEDCREALRQVFAGFETRARAAKKDYASLSKADLATFEGEVMRDKVAYAKPLLAEFGVTKLSELKPEQFGAFVAAAKPYIAGEA